MDSGWKNLWTSEQEPCWKNTATQSGSYWLEVANLSPVSYSMTFKDYHLLIPAMEEIQGQMPSLHTMILPKVNPTMPATGSKV